MVVEQVPVPDVWELISAVKGTALTHPKGPRSGFVASRGKVRVGRVAAPVT